MELLSHICPSNVIATQSQQRHLSNSHQRIDCEPELNIDIDHLNDRLGISLDFGDCAEGTYVQKTSSVDGASDKHNIETTVLTLELKLSPAAYYTRS